MKVLVTGVNGQLGFDVMRELKARKIEACGATRQEMPLTDGDAADAFVRKIHPDVVIHCAAYTAVDRAEDEPELCREINVNAVDRLAKSCAAIDAALLYISTDYVFSGQDACFYEPDDEKGPRNVYGRTKLAGELAVQAVLQKYFIVRTSWVFGIHGKNFIRTMLHLAKTHDTLTVVADQVGSPTYTVDLARLLADLAASKKYGVYHATNEGTCSWAELAAEVFRQRGLGVRVTPVDSAAYPVKAPRPHNSRLSKACLSTAGFARLPAWQDAVRRYLTELATIEE